MARSIFSHDHAYQWRITGYPPPAQRMTLPALTDFVEANMGTKSAKWSHSFNPVNLTLTSRRLTSRGKPSAIIVSTITGVTNHGFR